MKNVFQPEPEDVAQAMKSAFWSPFVKWAKENHVSMAATEDWYPWYDCYMAGASEGAHVQCYGRTTNGPSN